MNPAFFRSLAFLYRERAAILRAPGELTPRQRELMAKLFDSLASNAEEVVYCMKRLADAELSGETPAEQRRARIEGRKKR